MPEKLLLLVVLRCGWRRSLRMEKGELKEISAAHAIDSKVRDTHLPRVQARRVDFETARVLGLTPSNYARVHGASHRGFERSR